MSTPFPLRLPRVRPLALSGLPAAMGLGLLSALFFSVSFVANRGLSVGGGAWEWTAALRYLITLPVFAAVVGFRGGLGPVGAALRAAPGRWLLWGTVGFGLFYAPLCFAADSAPGWVVAAVWQVTIVCGMVLAPVLYRDPARRRIPPVALVLSLVVLGGVALTVLEAPGGLGWSVVIGVVAVLVGAVAYPVGNRKSMDLGGGLDTFQRVLALTVGSLPGWVVLAVVGGARTGLPSGTQVVGTALVALSSGVVATALFFAATRRVRDNPVHLAAVEATQAGEVVFVAVAEPLVLGGAAPGAVAWLGIVVIALGVVGYAVAGRG
ncbi:multidrug resistance efflux transporter family protein [Actinokineospora sp. PR83]|uniref:multidrug resistance efflux transporter family protein n=1 Tax=Actinokineospora sp. PR83 TaxID=2884908 RepID=UPI0027E0AAB5|nr:multidrug resistance efflux transporter family protein [Actinokineospora sp. PR83]MCG8920188.1 multidrug resistance efflux transporter family protein [Actinokineospora sp. PR83]